MSRTEKNRIVPYILKGRGFSRGDTRKLAYVALFLLHHTLPQNGCICAYINTIKYNLNKVLCRIQFQSLQRTRTEVTTKLCCNGMDARSTEYLPSKTCLELNNSGAGESKTTYRNNGEVDVANDGPSSILRGWPISYRIL